MAAVLAVLAEHVVAGTTITSDCEAKGIVAGGKEGTCTEGDTTLVVVDRHGVLKMASLEARLLGIEDRKTITGPRGSRTAPGEFVIFDLAITNRTDAPVAVADGQAMLYVGTPLSEAVEAEEGYERRSFLHRDREIPPRGTEDGTVVFSIATKRAAKVRTDGNLDFVNLGSSVSPLEPEAIFAAPEYGVIRLYQ